MSAGAVDPSPGEIWRRIEQVAQQLTAIADRLERRDNYVEENFLRRSVWHEARKADQGALANVVQDVGAIQKQQETERQAREEQVLADRNWRRQFGLAVGLAMLSSLLAIAGLIVTIVQG